MDAIINFVVDAVVYLGVFVILVYGVQLLRGKFKQYQD